MYNNLGTYGVDITLLWYRGGGTEIHHEFFYIYVVLMQSLRLLLL
jgi:hypothetical protein